MKSIPLSSLILFSLLFILTLSTRNKVHRQILTKMNTFKKVCGPVVELSFFQDTYTAIDLMKEGIRKNRSCFYKSMKDFTELRDELNDGEKYVNHSKDTHMTLN